MSTENTLSRILELPLLLCCGWTVCPDTPVSLNTALHTRQEELKARSLKTKKKDKTSNARVEAYRRLPGVPRLTEVGLTKVGPTFGAGRLTGTGMLTKNLCLRASVGVRRLSTFK